MSLAASLAAAFFALWIDYGWQPLAGGGHEYIVQVPPELIDTLRTDGLASYVPPEVRDIRRIRITVGSDSLPRQLNAPESDARRDEPAAGNGISPPEAETAAAQKGGDTNLTTAQSAESRTTKYAGEALDEAARPQADAANAANGRVERFLSNLGVDSVTAMQIGLGVAAAAIVFLLWAHQSMRRRYRDLLGQLRR